MVEVKRWAAGYLQRAPLWHWLVVRVFRRHVLRVCDRVIGEGYTAGVIDSRRMHELLAIQNAMLFPERAPAPGDHGGEREGT
jgi:hypothetical protein